MDLVTATHAAVNRFKLDEQAAEAVEVSAAQAARTQTREAAREPVSVGAR